MSEVLERLAETKGDASRYLPSDALTQRLNAFAAAPKENGRLEMIVRCPVSNQREILQTVHLSVEAGLPGDKWGAKSNPNPVSQLTVMRHDIADMIANGQSLALFGDNLFVNLDIAAANLPVGSRLQIGEAVIEVTPLPHDGCTKFKARFGADAFYFVNAKPTRHLNLRGICCRVVRAGNVEAGSAVRVVSRPAQTGELRFPA